MKKQSIKIMIIAIYLIGCALTVYGAEPDNQTILLDGQFGDWDNIGTTISNPQNSPDNNAELKTLKTVVRDGYVFFYIERWETEPSGYWDLGVMFFGNKITNKGKMFQYPPWDKKSNVPTIKVYVQKDDLVGQYRVDVYFPNYYMSTYAVSDDFREIEFVIPLYILEISSQLSDVTFSVNSVTDTVSEQEWISTAGPVVLAGVPIFGSAEPYIMILIACIVAYFAYKKDKQRNKVKAYKPQFKNESKAI